MQNALLPALPRNPQTMASPAMPATGAVVPPSDGSAGLGSQMPTNRQGKQPGMGNALRPQAAAPMAPVMTPQAPAPRPKNALLSGVASFAKGFDPEAFQMGEQRAQQTQAQEREKLMGMYQQALAWTDQALAMGDDAAMNQFIAQNAEKIQQTTGQDMRPVLAQGVNREQLMQERAALAAQLGQSPAQPEPMSAYEAAQIELKKTEAGQPQFFNTRDGVVAVAPGQDPKLAYGLSEEQQDLPEGMMYDEQGRPVEIPGYAAMRARIAAAGRAPGSGPETYRSLPPEEVAARGYPKGTVVQVDGRGKEYVNSRPSTQQTGQPTESERGAGLHAAISLNGIQAITRMEQGGYNRADLVNQMGGGLAGERERLYDQAADEFIDGYLRAMTGAAATKDEIATYKRQWFPQFGDSKKVLEQKARGRLNALKGMKSKAGRAWQSEWDGVISNLEQELGVAPAPAPQETDMGDMDGFIDNLFGPDDADGPPQGVDPEDWQFMSEEDRALFR